MNEARADAPAAIDSERFTLAKADVDQAMLALKNAILTDPTLVSVRLTIAFSRDPQDGRGYDGIRVETLATRRAGRRNRRSA